MVLAFKWDKARVWNRRGKPAPCLEWHHRIASDVEDQGRSFQFADLGANVEVIERVPQLPGVCCRSAAPLKFADPAKLLLGCIRNEQVGKDFSKCPGVAAPT